MAAAPVLATATASFSRAARAPKAMVRTVLLPPTTVVQRKRWTILLPEVEQFLREGILKLEESIHEGKTKLSSGEIIMLYTMVYDMSTQKAPHDYSEQLYTMYCVTIEEYTKAKVLPSLTEKHEEFMLEELVQRWSNHKLMVRSLSYFFGYLDRFFIPRRKLPSLLEVGLTTFQQLIYEVIKGNIKDALIATIKKKHVGEQMDVTFLKKLLDVLEEIGSSDSEDSFLKFTIKYCMEAQTCIRVPYAYYIIQDEQYLEREKLGAVMKESGEIRYVLFTQQYPRQVLEHELFALLRDDKLEDISRTYRFFESTGHLNELKDIFSKYLSGEVTYLVQQAGDSTINNEVVLWRFIGLHDIVMECFQKHPLFIKALKKSVTSRYSTELFGNIHQTIWKKDQFGRLTIEEEKIYQEVKGVVTDKLIALIGEQRRDMKIDEGNEVMMAFLRKVLDMLFDIKPACYMEDIVYVLINSTKDYYSKKAPSFVEENTSPEDYLKKVDECCKLEMEQAHLYSPFDMKHMIFEGVINVLIGSYYDKLLHDAKAGDDLSGMYKHCSEISGFQEPILRTFKEHLKNDTENFIQKYAASNMEDYVRELSGLVKNYKSLATKCFQDHASFHEAIEEEIKFNVNIDNLATYTLVAETLVDALCDIVQNKVYDDKVLILLPYIGDKDTFADICRIKLAGRLQESCTFNEHLSRAYQLFSQTIGGHEPFNGMFKMHLRNEVMKLVNKAAESASNKADFAHELIRLHDKYIEYATKIFHDHASFHKAIKDTFSFKFIGGCHTLVSEILADTVCDNILNNGRSEMLSDEGVKVHHDKVLILFRYFSNKDTFADICRKKIAGRLQEASTFLDLRHAMDEYLPRMYRLFSETIGGQEPFIGMFKAHLWDDIMDLVQNAAHSASDKEGLVSNIIELHDKYEVYVTECFQGHRKFQKALSEIFEFFCNNCISGSLMAELLTTFCHNIIRKGYSEKLSSEDVELAHDKVVRLLAYIYHDRDLFKMFYRKELGRRLLFEQPVDDKHETNILKKLDAQFGHCPITQKMNGMISDIIGASAYQDMFKDFITTHPEINPGIDMSVTVLCKQYWPRYKIPYIKLPAEMEKCEKAFEEFYQSKIKKRKLSWMYSLGNCNINATFETKTIELIATPSQAAILLLFNEFDRLSCSEVAKMLNVSDDYVMPLLHSLSSDKYKILNKFLANGTGSPNDDYFEFNSKFRDEMGIIKMPRPADKKKLIENANMDRIYAIEASIVRIMKIYKVMCHKKLVSKCAKQLSLFKPDERAIKKRIESLIDREYIERDKDNVDTYRYKS